MLEQRGLGAQQGTWTTGTCQFWIGTGRLRWMVGRQKTKQGFQLRIQHFLWVRLVASPNWDYCKRLWMYDNAICWNGLLNDLSATVNMGVMYTPFAFNCYRRTDNERQPICTVCSLILKHTQAFLRSKLFWAQLYNGMLFLGRQKGAELEL